MLPTGKKAKEASNNDRNTAKKLKIPGIKIKASAKQAKEKISGLFSPRTNKIPQPLEEVPIQRTSPENALKGFFNPQTLAELRERYASALETAQKSDFLATLPQELERISNEYLIAKQAIENRLGDGNYEVSLEDALRIFKYPYNITKLDEIFAKLSEKVQRNDNTSEKYYQKAYGVAKEYLAKKERATAEATDKTVSKFDGTVEDALAMLGLVNKDLDEMNSEQKRSALAKQYKSISLAVHPDKNPGVDRLEFQEKDPHSWFNGLHPTNAMQDLHAARDLLRAKWN